MSKATYYRYLTPGVRPGKTDHDNETNVDQNFGTAIDTIDAPTVMKGNEEIEVIENMEDYFDDDNSCRHENEFHIENCHRQVQLLNFSINFFFLFN